MRARLRRDEEGSALILALFFLILVALFVLPMVTLLDVGQRSSTALRAQRDVSLAADAAVDAAVNRFRSGAACDDYLAPWRIDPLSGNPVPVANEEMLVNCRQEAVTAGALATKPGYGLLSLAGAGEDGIAATAGTVRVRGDLFSSSTVLGAGGGSTVVEGTVSALGDCTQVATVPESILRCANQPGGAADPVRGRDPDFDKLLTTVPAPGALTTGTPAVAVPPGTCPPAEAWRIDVWPGYYDDAAVFNAFTDNPACAGKVLWFHPGSYLFNFGFRPGSAAVWTVNDPAVNVVGGTARGEWPSSATRPTAAHLPVPGGCKAEEDPAPGVQMVLGGASRLEVLRGKVELCAPHSPDDQRIALYGLPTPRPVHTLAPTTVVNQGGFLGTAGVVLIGEVGPPATAALDTTGPSASLKVQGFRRFVRSDAVIDSAVLRVVHREVGDVGAVKVTLPVECGGDTALALQPAPGVEATVDLKAACAGAADPAYLAKALSRTCEPAPAAPPLTACLEVTYSAQLAPGGAPSTAEVDGIWIDVAYREPVTRKPSATAPAPTDAVFANPANAFQIGERPVTLTADAALTAALPTATLRLTGYGEPRVQPDVSVDAAVLRVAHTDEGDVATASVTVPGACGTQPLTVDDEAHVDRIDLKACGLTAADLTGLSVTYTTALTAAGTTATSRIDGIWLDLVTGPAPARAPTVHDNGAGGFADAANALALDAAVATAALDSAAVPAVNAASLTVSAFGAALPAGSAVEAATVRVRHREDATPATPAPAVTVKASRDGGATFCLPDTPVAASPGGLGTASLDVLAACGGPTPFDPSQLSVTFTAALDPGGTAATVSLDGVELDLRYRPPTARRPAAGDGGAGGFTVDAANALAIDGASAGVILNAGADPPVTTASITLSDFGPALPAGSLVEYARLRIAHQDEGAVPPVLTVKASIDAGATFCLAETPVAPSPGALGVATVALDGPGGCDLSDPSLLAVTYTVTLGEGGVDAVAALDGIELDLRFRPPAFDPVGGCATTGPYPATGCALVKVAPGVAATATRFVVAGTVYAPSAAVDVSLIDVRNQVITRGVVARTIRLGTVAVASFRRPVVGVPPEAVVFTASSARTLRPATATDNGGFATTPDAGRAVDGTFAAASLTGADPPPTATLLLSAFGTPSTSFQRAFLRVRHRDDPGLAEVRLTLTLSDATTFVFSSVSGGTPCQLCHSQGEWVEDQLALPGVTPGQLAGATATYEATARIDAPAGTAAELDGVELVEVLTGPRLQARVEFDPSVTRVVGWSVRR